MPGYIATAAGEPHVNGEAFEYQHQAFCQVFGTHRAPVDFSEPLRVLDVGCGTGSWSAELARNHPNVRVMGIDTGYFDSWYTAPANCAFEFTDMEDDDFWNRCKERYDLVHTRCLVTACRDWPALVQRCYGALKPGGWLEMQDVDRGGIQLASSNKSTPCKSLEWSDAFTTSLALAGYLTDAMHHVPSYMSNTGFQEVVTEDHLMPIGDWPEDTHDQEVGSLCLDDLEWRVNPLARGLFTDMLGMSDVQARALSDAFVAEVRQRMVRSYLPLRLVYARKPV